MGKHLHIHHWDQQVKNMMLWPWFRRSHTGSNLRLPQTNETRATHKSKTNITNGCSLISNLLAHIQNRASKAHGLPVVAEIISTQYSKTTTTTTEGGRVQQNLRWDADNKIATIRAAGWPRSMETQRHNQMTGTECYTKRRVLREPAGLAWGG